MTVVLELPEPPSVNRMWRNVGRRTLLSKDGRHFKAQVALIARALGVRPLTGPVAVEVVWRRKRRSGDLDNRLKSILDSLNALAYHDDSQIVELRAVREDDPKHPGCRVTVRAA